MNSDRKTFLPPGEASFQLRQLLPDQPSLANKMHPHAVPFQHAAQHRIHDSHHSPHEYHLQLDDQDDLSSAEALSAFLPRSTKHGKVGDY